MFLIWFLIILLALYYIVPRLLRWWIMRRLQKSTDPIREAFERMWQQRKGAERSEPRRHRKKIDPEVGEYVAFEEVQTQKSETTYADSTNRTVRIEKESQIEDAVWEEIK